VDRRRRAGRARRHAGALRPRPRVGTPRGRRRLRRHVVGRRAGAGGLRDAAMQGKRVGRPLVGRAPGALAVRQALPRLRRHALPRGLVHGGARRPHRPTRRRRDRRGIRVHMVRNNAVLFIGSIRSDPIRYSSFSDGSIPCILDSCTAA
jgi:hypothetical protein